MECTGERYMPEFDGDWTLEHTHRYLLACELAWGKSVLDIACGDGYGSRMLADMAARVVGVDISLETTVRAAAKYRHPRLQFLQGSATAIPLADDSVDFVVSFETIEHLGEHEAMLREIRRVLRPDGLLLISSPDKYEYSDMTGYVNAYHVKELYRHEFEGLLRARFSHIRMLGQRVVFGSVMGAEEQGAFYSWRKGEPARATGLGDAEYLIALAGDAPLPALPSSILKTPLEQSNRVRELKEEQQGVTKHLVAALDRTAWYEDWEKEARGYIAELEAYKAKQESYKAELEACTDRVQWYEEWEKEARAYIAQLEERNAELAKIYDSRSWKITAPLRSAAHALRRLRCGQEPATASRAEAPPPSKAASRPVTTWPPDVRALEKPLPLDSLSLDDAAQSRIPVGVFLHIYYTELAGEMLSCMANLPETARVHISTDSESKEQILRTLLAKHGLEARAEVRVCPNRGWDVAPFLVGFADRIPEYPLILRLHSKRSTHFSKTVGESWRNMQFASLAGTAARVAAVTRAFEEDPGLGMVCPPIPDHYTGSVTYGGNLPLMKWLLREHGIDIQPDTPLDFPMGSMFWCRPDVLSPWLDRKFSYNDFTLTMKNDRDGSLAHALERLFFFGCGITGYSWSRLGTDSQDAVCDRGDE